jgi:hypothetical protein
MHATQRLKDAFHGRPRCKYCTCYTTQEAQLQNQAHAYGQMGPECFFRLDGIHCTALDAAAISLVGTRRIRRVVVKKPWGCSSADVVAVVTTSSRGVE